MKVSQYNIYVENHIYNLITNHLIEVSPDLFDYLKDNDRIDTSLFDDEIVHKLYNINVLTDSDIDEKDVIELNYNRDKYDTSFLSFIVYPTLKCNFNCHYCFELYKYGSMTNEKFDILYKFLKKQAAEKRFLALRWSGGEPLLLWSKIYEFSKKMIKACQQNDCQYLSTLVTNGSLLNERIVHEMIESNITSLQITLDGPPEIHDSIRYTKENGEGTFNKVLEGIEIASQYMKVLIRININRMNISHIKELITHIANSKINTNNARLFVKPVICSPLIESDGQEYKHREFYQLERELIHLTQQFNIPYSFHIGVTSRNTRCLYHTLNGFLLDPNLQLYRCPVFLGVDKKSIGHLDSEQLNIINGAEYIETLKYSPFENSECFNCKVLPICNGKCPVLWEQAGKAKEEGCIPDKYTFEDKLKYAIKSPQQLSVLKNTNIS